MDTAGFKQRALELGADLIGIAPVSRFAGVPPDADPLAIQPGARSVVVLAFSINRGALAGVESGMAWHTLAGGIPSAVAVDSTYLICRALEAEGWEATPLFRQPGDQRHQGVAVSPDRQEPNVILEFDYAAHAAGLGEVGRGKWLLTPQFGPRQILTIVLTDAPLEPDPLFSGSICDDCGACAAACPARAMDSGSRHEAALCEGCASWYPLHIESCRVCKTGITHLPYSGGTEPFRLGAACGRACVAHLEEIGALTRRFATPFRSTKQGGR